MTARARVGRVQRVLAAVGLTQALLWAAAAALLVLAVGGSRGWAAAAAATAAVAALVRLRAIGNRARVALWLEEQLPALGYALITGFDPAGAAHASALDAQPAKSPFDGVATRAGIRSPRWPALAVGVAVVGFLAGTGLRGGAALPIGAAADRARSPAAANALRELTVVVEPPEYSGLAPERIDDPARVAALAGSRLRVEGSTGGRAVTARADSVAVAVSSDQQRWIARLVMPLAPAVLHLAHGTNERLLLLEPRIDSVPVVTVESPPRDTVFRSPTGILSLAASFRDDFGLREGWWELVISRGEGERFEFETIVLGRTPFGNARTGRRTHTVVVDSLRLAPGDLVHLRAVARDGNDATGPGIAGSDVRILRIARPDEYDSVAVEGIPPPDPLAGLLSQRMLITLTEALERRRPRLPRAELVVEAGRIARDQDALRRQVGDLVFARLEEDAGGEHAHGEAHDHRTLTPEQLLAEAEAATARATGKAVDFAEDESPVVGVNRPLLEAYNAMWAAGRELRQGATAGALPHMHAALAAIQRARKAERLYLRGATRPVIVDLAKVRMVGKRDGIEPSPRRPRAADPAATRRTARFDAAVAELARRPSAAIDSLLVIRVELLGTGPEIAGPLGEAVDALRAGRDATTQLVAARRALSGPADARAGLSPWSPVR